MAIKSKIARNLRRKKMIDSFEKKRILLKKEKKYLELQKLPRKAFVTRFRNRDLLDGRSRGFMRKFGLSRLNFRKLAHQGLIPGVVKSSW